MSLYTNFNYALLDEAYGTPFKYNAKKASNKKHIITDPSTP